MQTKRAASIAVLSATLFGIAGGLSANAQDWPSRPVTMVVTNAAGGGPDTVGRIIATRLSEILGRQVVVENVAAAGGMTGATRVAKAAPDGYQLLLGSTGNIAQIQHLVRSTPYNGATDFAPVVLMAEAPLLLIARKDLPTKSLRSFLVHAKANAPKMQFGSPGVGSVAHLACALLNIAGGLNVVHVPYRGNAPAMQDLIAGRIDYLCASVPAVIAQLESKMVTPIAMLSRDRSPILPDLATAHEQGLDNFDAGVWFALFFPRATPEPIVRKLHDATVTAMNTPSVRNRLRDMGVDLVAPERRSPEYLQDFVKKEIEKWGVVIRAANIKPE